MDGGSSERCSRSTFSPALPLPAPPARTVASRRITSRDSPSAERRSSSRICSDSRARRAPATSARTCSAPPSRTDAASASRRSSAAWTSRRASRRADPIARTGAAARRRPRPRRAPRPGRPARSRSRSCPAPQVGEGDAAHASHRLRHALTSGFGSTAVGRSRSVICPYHPRMSGTAAGDIDRGKLREIKAREDAAFVAARPRSAELWARAKASMPNGVPMSWLRTSYDHPPLFVAEGRGARFRDVDGHEYADFNIADMSMFGGYAPEPVVEAVARRVGAGHAVPAAERGCALGGRGARPPLRPAEVAVHAQRDRTPTPRRSASARALTGREQVLVLRRQVSRPLRRRPRGAGPGRRARPRGGRPAAATSPSRRRSCRSTIPRRCARR